MALSGLSLTALLLHPGCTRGPADWDHLGILGGHWGLHVSPTRLQDAALAFIDTAVCPIKCDGAGAAPARQQVRGRRPRRDVPRPGRQVGEGAFFSRPSAWTAVAFLWGSPWVAPSIAACPAGLLRAPPAWENKRGGWVGGRYECHTEKNNEKFGNRI